MRRVRAITAAMFALLFVALAPTVPVEAQYGSVLPSPEDCTDVAPPTVIVTGTAVTILFAPNTRECATEVVVVNNPVLYQGEIPVSHILKLTVPIEGPLSDVILTTTTLKNDDEIVVRTPFTRDSSTTVFVPRAPKVSDGPGGAVADLDPTPLVLAHTGTTVGLPAATAMALISIGVVLVLTARWVRSEEATRARLQPISA